MAKAKRTKRLVWDPCQVEGQETDNGLGLCLFIPCCHDFKVCFYLHNKTTVTFIPVFSKISLVYLILLSERPLNILTSVIPLEASVCTLIQKNFS